MSPPKNNSPLMPSPRSVSRRRRLLYAAQRCLYWTGCGAAYIHTRRINGTLILMYHSVPDEDLAPWIDPGFAVQSDEFRTQMSFLAHHRHVFSMRELVEACGAGQVLPRGSVVITFDDGYRDNVVTAAPILEEFELPATFFLATSYVDSGEPQWIDRLYAAFKLRSDDALDLTGWGLSDWDLASQAGVDLAHHGITGVLLASGWQRRLDLLGEIERQLKPAGKPVRTTLNWDEVRKLSENPRFELGGHTRTHIDLSTCTDEDSSREVIGCLEDIRRETNREVIHFAFPHGRSRDSVRKLLAEAGVESAALTDPARPVRREDDVFALPRLDAGLDMTIFRFMTSGAYPDLPLALFRRA